MLSGRNRFAFTASQWQELEHQALIFKYMASGIPIPPDLLFTIKRSCFDSPLSSKLFSHQPLQHISWNYLQMGLGRKIDPEPGRCRRTDGKKWRCSKEAFPDSKYCERHMHRGKNRSRKPVEVMKAITSTATITNLSSPTISSIIKNHSVLTPTAHDSLSSLSAMSSETHHHLHNSYYDAHLHQPFIHNPTSSSRLPGIGLSPPNNSLYVMEPASYSQITNTDYRYNINGLKEEVDEHAFFSESSGSMRSLSGPSMDDSWQLTPLTMSTSSKQSTGFSDSAKQPEQDRHSFVLDGAVKKDEMRMHVQEEKEQPQKTFHRFFDEWPPKERDSWGDLDDKPLNSSSTSTTRLSISIPNSFHDFPIFNSRTHNGN
ncbi:growth-regulating factor 6-like isoform X2 [Juglans microcarpa x Juglans regia]|uniref:growth-regulating factor 6-like isoform X2 n=1 Tax=Juglans microcarpa x Juglans regia TaxID=2249226 RepID=UPI001B7F43FC|nr:growth-regulating factor 6-like isoform X2 [Juglans microcarpa x Juglans regia]